jgi:hypothetical protein
MSQRMMTMSAHIFFRLLVYAPEELQRQAKADARRAIPAFCFTEADIRRTLVQEEGWEILSDDERCRAITDLLEASRYEPIAAAASQAIAEAAVYYLADVLLEKAEQQEGGSNELE